LESKDYDEQKSNILELKKELKNEKVGLKEMSLTLNKVAMDV